jgi:hypothetical protein
MARKKTVCSATELKNEMIISLFLTPRNLKFHPDNIQIFCSYLTKNIKAKYRVMLYSGIIVFYPVNHRAHIQCTAGGTQSNSCALKKELTIFMLPHTGCFIKILDESPQRKENFSRSRSLFLRLYKF